MNEAPILPSVVSLMEFRRDRGIAAPLDKASGTEMDSEDEDFEEVPSDCWDLGARVVFIARDTHPELHIESGDRLFVRPTSKPDPEFPAIFLYQGKVRIEHVEALMFGYRIHGEDPASAPIIVEPGEDFRVFGVVVGFARDIKKRVTVLPHPLP